MGAPASNFGGFTADSRLQSSRRGVQRWSATRDDATAELFLGDPDLAREAARLPRGGPFTELSWGVDDDQGWVLSPVDLRLPLSRLHRPLPHVTALGITLLIAEALRGVHDHGAWHGHLHPDTIGFDSRGILRVRPALHYPAMAEPRGDDPGPATDCRALGSIALYLLGQEWPPQDLTPPKAWDEVDSSRAGLILTGMLRDSNRLRLTPASAVVQSLAALFHLAGTESDAAVRELVAQNGLGGDLRTRDRVQVERPTRRRVLGGGYSPPVETAPSAAELLQAERLNAERRAEEDARRRAEDEARRQAEEDARRRAEAELERARETARQQADEARRQAEEARRLAEEQLRAEFEQKMAEERARFEAERQAAEEARMQAEAARAEAEAQAREAEERRRAEEQARREEEARREAEEIARREAAERQAAEEAERKAAEAAEAAKQAATAKARKAAEKARKEAEKARKEAEERARNAAEEAARRAEERRLAEEKRQAEEQARREAEEKRRAEEKARREAEAKRRAEEKARREAEEQARREAAEKARQEAEKARQAAEQARREAEARARREAEEQARREADERARREAEARRRAEEQARREAEERARREAEEQARRDAEARRRADEKRAADEQARRDAEEAAKKAAAAAAAKKAADAAKKAADEAARQERARAEAAKKAAEDKARAEQRARDEAEAVRQKAEAEEKARREAAEKARREAAAEKRRARKQAEAKAARKAAPAPGKTYVMSVEEDVDEDDSSIGHIEEVDEPASADILYGGGEVDSILGRDRDENDDWLMSGDVGVKNNTDREKELGKGKWAGVKGRSAAELREQLGGGSAREMDIADDPLPYGKIALAVGMFVAVVFGGLWWMGQDAETAPTEAGTEREDEAMPAPTIREGSWVMVTTDPAGSRITFDGKDMGKAPAEIPLPDDDAAHTLCVYKGSLESCRDVTADDLLATDPFHVDADQ